MTKAAISKPARNVTDKLSAQSRARRRELKGAVALEVMAYASRRNDLIPDMKLEVRPIASLRPPKRNVRARDPLHEAEIAGSISELGLAAPPIITPDGEIINGVSTVASASTLGLAEIPCIVISDLSPERIKLLRIALNRLAEKGSWDFPELKLVFEELVLAEAPVVVTGFTLPEIDLVIMSDEPTIDAKANDCPALNNDQPAVSRVGDQWIAGRHRVLGADATKPESYALLLGDTPPARAVFTDPPYNLDPRFISGNPEHGAFVAGSGELTDDQFVTFLADFLKAVAAHVADGGILFMCMDWRHCEHVLRAARGAGLTVVNIAVWSKGSGGLGGLYRSAHEFVFVLKKGDGPILNNVELGKHGRDRTNVWVYPGANQRGSSANAELANHPTPKPVELVSDAILDVTKRGDVIIDPFLGSGTSIISAQKTGRTVYGLELDPHYVDLIIRRFEAFTGIEVIHAETGKTFAQLAEERRAAPATGSPDGSAAGESKAGEADPDAHACNGMNTGDTVAPTSMTDQALAAPVEISTPAATV